jgi:hypothetical protein
MVIPIGGGGDMGGAALIGPPPDELLPRFKKIKVSLLVIMISILGKLIFGILLDPSFNNTYSLIVNLLTPILLAIIGIFLLKDDPLFKGCYECIVNTCFSSCREQCPGGMTCLCSWFFCNLLTAIIDLLPLNGSGISTVVSGCQQLGNPSQWGPGGWVWVVEFCGYLLSVAFALLAQIFGGYHGFKAYQQAQEFGAQAGGDWANDGGGTSGYPAAREVRQGPNAEAARPAQQGFQAFGGAGQRLGS